MTTIALSLLTLGVWAYLLFGRGWFWLCREDDESVALSNEVASGNWPSVVAIIPARNEADMIPRCVGSLLRQNYGGRFSIVVVDDQSSDGTAAAASAAANSASFSRLQVLAGSILPPGWTGKLWALQQGLLVVERIREAPEFVLFSDADIDYGPNVLRRLVAIALAKRSVLTSLMVKLSCASPAERWFVPSFVFFFRMLYPFTWVNDPRRRAAAAAGGCMLVHRETLACAGGLEALRDALIDDCALGALMKRQGPIWLGLTEQAHSMRVYPALADFRRMVARSAFAELRYSPWRLAGAIGGMCVTYIAPPFFAIFGRGVAQLAGVMAWAAMALAFGPMLRFYRRPLAYGLALPAVAAAYIVFTVESAIEYWRGQGGHWKGRIQAPMGKAGHA